MGVALLRLVWLWAFLHSGYIVPGTNPADEPESAEGISRLLGGRRTLEEGKCGENPPQQPLLYAEHMLR